MARVVFADILYEVFYKLAFKRVWSSYAPPSRRGLRAGPTAGSVHRRNVD